MIKLSRQHRGVSGIYKAIHRETGMSYVGSAVDLWRRRLHHKSLSLRGSSMVFHRAIQKFGWEMFDFVVLEECSKDDLQIREDFWIRTLNTASCDGFNTCSKSACKNGFTLEDSTRARMSIAHKGKVRSEEHRKNLSESLKGRKLSLEHRQKLKLRPKRNLSDETKLKLSLALKGKVKPPISEETRRKMSLANKGRQYSDDYKIKMSNSLKGRVFSDAAKKKMSDSAKLRRARERFEIFTKIRTAFHVAPVQ